MARGAVMDRDRPPGVPPDQIRPGRSGSAGQARSWRGTCRFLGIGLLAAVVSSPATLTGPVPPAPDRTPRAERAWLTGTTVGTARQTIDFGQPEGTSASVPATAVGASVALQATASSGPRVSLRSHTPLGCTGSR